MAPKRPTPMEDPPSASSSEEEVETSSGEEEEEEEEEEVEEETAQDKNNQKPLASPPPSQPREEEEEESEYETDSDAEQPDPKAIKPVSSKPVEEAPKTSNPRSKSVPVATSKSAALGKRGLETDRDEKDSKRVKKNKEVEEDGVTIAGVEKSDGKKQLFQRLWSEEDELVVLKGVIDFVGKKGIDPAKDMIAFYDFIKNCLHIDVTMAQLKDKVWRLKRKFENHVKKGKQGEEKTFAKNHDQKVFDLSKRIWGSEGTVSKESTFKSNGKVANKGGKEKANVKTLVELEEQFELASSKGNKRESLGFREEKMMGLGKLEVIGGMEEYVLRKGMEMRDGANRVEMEERLRKLHIEEIKLFLRRIELVKENAELLLAAYSEADED